MSGSVAMQVAGSGSSPPRESSIASSMFTSMSWAPVVDLLAGDLDGLVLEPVLEDQLRELARAGDVRPLADVDEDVAGLRDRDRLEARTAGSSRSISGGWRGGRPATASAIACDVGRRRAAAAAGDVEQAVAGELAQRRAAICSGVSS